MNTVEQMLQVAQDLQDKGKIEEALAQYSKSFDLLIDEAGKYAKEQESDITDLPELRKIADKLFEHSKIYLKRNINAAYILNAMGVLFAQLKDYPNAQQRLVEAMEFIPDGTDYSDPADNLERISGEVAAARAAADEEESE
ncbi:MAG: hypothetical protein JWL92_667 [Candidatus Nomurabacteria bacterium]|nr:hypothetical protein [Candidatus Nomurabacteria bacterium]